MKDLTYWEYKYINQRTRTGRSNLHSGIEQIEGMLNENGAEGWELVSVIKTRAGLGSKIFRYFFKRPKIN